MNHFFSVFQDYLIEVIYRDFALITEMYSPFDRDGDGGYDNKHDTLWIIHSKQNQVLYFEIRDIDIQYGENCEFDSLQVSYWFPENIVFELIPICFVQQNYMGLNARKPVLGCANNKGAVQAAHARSLISAFVIPLFEYFISRLATSTIFQLVCVAEETALSFALLETPKKGFLAMRPIWTST